MKKIRRIKAAAASLLISAAVVCCTIPVNTQNTPAQYEPETFSKTPDTSDAIRPEMSNVTLYDFSNERNYGYSGSKGDQIDFEAYFGVTLKADGQNLVCTPYTHTSSASPVSMTLSSIMDRKRLDLETYNCGTDPVAIDTASLPDGTYTVTMLFDTKSGDRSVSGYFYKDGKSLQTCRFANAGIEVVTADQNIWNYKMSDADPDDYLSNALITYPTSGDGRCCNHTKEWEKIADEIIGDHMDWSDELKVFAFTQWLVENVAYDNYKLDLRKSRAAIANDYTDDNLFTLGNRVGVCWDYVNIMTIMCRHYGVPATSADYGTHTVCAVWLHDGWVAIDLTALNLYSCDTEDTSRSGWKKADHYAYSVWYGYYDSSVYEHDDNIWTQRKGVGLD